MKRIILIVSAFFIVGLLLGCGAKEAAEVIINYEPTITSLTASTHEVSVDETVIVTCEATDQDGDTLSYSWSATGGAFLTSMGQTNIWTAPTSAQTCIVTATVSDGRSTSHGSLTIYVSSPFDTTLPSAPAGLTAKAGNAAITLTWEANSESDLYGYNLYRSTGSGYSKINSSLITATTYLNSGLTNGITYYYKIKAVDTSLNESNYSSQAQAVPSSGASISYSFVWQNASTITLKGPWDLVVSSDGNYVYVTDQEIDKVIKYNTSSGNYVSNWSYDFRAPTGIGIDSSGNIWVTDTIHHQIKKFSAVGSHLATYGTAGSGQGEFSLPTEITFDSEGNIYITDERDFRVQKFNSSFNYLLEWGEEGSGNGQFNKETPAPWEAMKGIVADSNNNVYMADVGNHRIQKFDKNGNFLAKWGSYGSGNGQFNSPKGLAIDSSNNIYVADQRNHRIQIFDSNGNFIASLGSYGSGNGQFNLPTGVAVDSAGNVYVADPGNDRIQKFSP